MTPKLVAPFSSIRKGRTLKLSKGEWAIPMLVLIASAGYHARAQENDGTAGTQSCVLSGLTGKSSTVTDDDLFRAYSTQASAIRSLEASAVIRGRSGLANEAHRGESKPSGATIYFRAPGWLRMTGEVPMSARRTFDLLSDGREFQLLIPDGPEMRLIEGPVDARAVSSNPRENLRPQPLIEALRWPAARLSPLHQNAAESTATSRALLLDLKDPREPSVSARVLFDVQKGVVSQIDFRDRTGKLAVEARYDSWRPVGGGGCYPRHVALVQPEQQIRLDLQIVLLLVNQHIPSTPFRLSVPPGAPVTHLSGAGTIEP